MLSYDEDIFSCLIPNEDKKINRGYGYFIKSGVSEIQRAKIREWQDRLLEYGKPYWVLDFLAEDAKLDPDCIRIDPMFGFFRKYKPKSKDDVSESE